MIGFLQKHRVDLCACSGWPRTGRDAWILAACKFGSLGILALCFISTSTTKARAEFPNDKTTGVSKRWQPTQTYNGLRITKSGYILEDARINGNLVIDADNVTVRRVEVLGGVINTRCRKGVVLQRVTVARAPGQTTRWSDEPAVGPGGYQANRVKIYDLPEGFRVSGASSGCGKTVIKNSFVLVTAPDVCGNDQWHGDGIQGYDGPPVVVRNTTIDYRLRSGCGGTAPFFYPHSQGNKRANIDGLLVMGGGYSFRLGMPATVRGLRIKQGSWKFGPIDVRCSAVKEWEAQIVAVDTNYQPTTVVQKLPCNTNGGN